MDVETHDLHDWVVLHSSDEVLQDSESIQMEDSERIIRSDYFSLDSHINCSYTVRVAEVESFDRNWSDPGSETRSPRKELSEFWSDSGYDESDESKLGEFGGKYELGSDGVGEIVARELDIVETGNDQLGSDGIESESGSDSSGTRVCDSSGFDAFEDKIEMGVVEKRLGDEKDEADPPSEGGDKDVVIGAMKSEEEHKRVMVWWKIPLELLRYCVFKVNPVWTVSMAAAVMGFVILGRRYYRLKRKNKSMQLKVTTDDKKVAQFMSRAARLNEAFSVVKRVPVVRPSLPTAGGMPWPAMSLRQI